MIKIEVSCLFCNGTGIVPKKGTDETETCSTCKGSGKVLVVTDSSDNKTE